MFALFHPFKILQDLQDFHLMENNVMFNLIVNMEVLVYNQIHKVVPSYHDHNIIKYHLLLKVLININSFFSNMDLCNAMN